MNDNSPFAINHFLKSKGFASLTEAGALIPQLAFLVRDDEHFKTLLNACEFQHRRSMYEALAPNLRFKPKPLWQYEHELRVDAERRQLPTIGEGGKLEPFKVGEIATAPKKPPTSSTERLTESLTKEHLVLVCSKCTVEAVFHGITRTEAVMAARDAGWKQRKVNGKWKAACSKCLKTKTSK